MRSISHLTLQKKNKKLMILSNHSSSSKFKAKRSIFKSNIIVLILIIVLINMKMRKKMTMKIQMRTKVEKKWVQKNKKKMMIVS
jgi:hypothetical protein